MVRLFMFGPDGPERLPARPSGEWVRLTRRELATEPNPVQDMVDDLVRRYDPGGYQLTCPVAGCRWALDVPRMELDPEPLDADAGDWVVRAEAVPREDLELVLRTHLDLHAVMTETDVRDAPLPAEPVA